MSYRTSNSTIFQPWFTIAFVVVIFAVATLACWSLAPKTISQPSSNKVVARPSASAKPLKATMRTKEGPGIKAFDPGVPTKLNSFGSSGVLTYHFQNGRAQATLALNGRTIPIDDDFSKIDAGFLRLAGGNEQLGLFEFDY